MLDFWRTQKGLARLRLTSGGVLNYLRTDISETLARIQQRFGTTSASEPLSPVETSTGSRPIVFAGACVDANNPGGWKYNGGIKELNYLVKLLRQKGFEAYFVTYDGTYEPWLMDHQETISLSEMVSKAKSAKAVRYVTSWAKAEAFLAHVPTVYFWDMELAYTDNRHFSTLARLYRSKISGTAAISRTIQAWHMAYFGRPTVLIPNLMDTEQWKPNRKKQKPNRVGYMDEGDLTTSIVRQLTYVTKHDGLDLEFFKISGDEPAVLDKMQTCRAFISLNQGKDPLWGEGCPRTILEAMAAGCVSLSFDIIGNRETVISGFNGVIVSRGRTDLFAAALVKLFRHPDTVQELQHNAQEVIASAHTLASRWSSVASWLDLGAWTDQK